MMLKNEKENKMNDIYTGLIPLNDAKWKIKENDIYTGLIPLNDAKWKRKENEWYLYGFDTVKWC